MNITWNVTYLIVTYVLPDNTFQCVVIDDYITYAEYPELCMMDHF